MKTLLLDRTTWDLCLDATGNIALAAEPYALAQDAASAIKLFSAELWYNTDKGVPYFETILGHFPPLALMRAKLKEAALTVPGVVKAECFITSVKDRAVTGQVQITDKDGTKLDTAFGNVDMRAPGGSSGVAVYGSSSYGDGSVYG